MSHVPDMEKAAARRAMDVGFLVRMLFVDCRPVPASVQQHISMTYVHPEAGTSFMRVHLAACWAAFGVTFDDVQLRPSTEHEGALRARVEVPDQGEVLRQLQQGFEAVSCEDIVFRVAGEGPGGHLSFTMPATMVNRLRGKV